MFNTILILMYFVPSIIGAMKDREDIGKIFLINIFFGWTIIGWAIALNTAYTRKNWALD